MNRELLDIQAGFRKGRGTRDQIANIRWIIAKAREFQRKHLLLLYWLHQSLWLCGSQQIVENSSRDGNNRSPDLPPNIQVKKQQLEPDMEQQTGSKLGKEFVKAVFVVQLVKNLPAMWETWVWSLGWVDPLEKGKATHSSILAWRLPWGHKESDTTEWLWLHFIWCKELLPS